MVVEILAKGKRRFKGTKASFNGVVGFNVDVVDCFVESIVVSIYAGIINGCNVGIMIDFDVGIDDR